MAGDGARLQAGWGIRASWVENCDYLFAAAGDLRRVHRRELRAIEVVEQMAAVPAVERLERNFLRWWLHGVKLCVVCCISAL